MHTILLLAIISARSARPQRAAAISGSFRNLVADG
jgi:hypothetical protein